MAETNTETYKPQIVMTPLSRITIVDRKHPHARNFFTPRNEWRTDPNLVKQLKEAGRPEHPVILYPLRDDGKNVSELIAIDGNQRVKAALEAGLTEIPSEVRWDWTLDDAIKASAKLNATRRENDFETKLMLVHRMVKPDENAKATGMSYDEAALFMNVTHTVVRSLTKMTFFPKAIRSAIQTGKLSFTTANQELVPLWNDKEALVKRFQELMDEGSGAEGEGIPKPKGKTQRQAKLSKGEAALTKNQWRILATKRDCPEEMSALIEVFVGDKTLDWGKQQGLDWLEVPVVAKATKKKKGAVVETKKAVEEIDDSLFA